MISPGALPPNYRRIGLETAAFLAVAIGLAYANSISTPFVFDDLTSIKANPTIRHLWPLSDVLATPRGTGDTVDGRPLLNLSFALNYALSGLDPRGYHVTNLLIHFGAACLLYGIVRRTAERASMPTAFRVVSTGFAQVVALLWSLHPLTTAAVTYTAQRAESLAAFFLLLTVHAFIRSLEPWRRPRQWQAVAVVACLAGAATKEAMVAAPFIVLLYDRAFAAGSFRDALRQRPILYALLATSWLLIAALVFATQSRGSTAGFSAGISPWHYALTQAEALVRYVALAFWPSSLVFDYGTSVQTTLRAVWPQAALVILLLAGAIFALVRFPRIGFVAGAFFALLAPSSSVVPVATQTIAEHRMYLPLAAVLVLALGACVRWLGPRAPIVALVLLAPALGYATYQRNRDYASPLALWRNTAEKRPDNPRALVHYGLALLQAGDMTAAEPVLARAVRLAPESSEAQTNFGVLLLRLGRVDEAVAAHAAAVRLRPESAATRANYGQALLAAGRPTDALAELEAALRLDPRLPGLAQQLGTVLLQLKRAEAALPHLERAVDENASDAEARFQWASALLALQRTEPAMQALQTVLTLDPNHAGAHNNLGNLLLLARRPAEAVPHFRKVLEQHPASAPAHTNLGLALVLSRDLAGAEAEFRAALQLDPNYAPARTNLERLERAR